MNENVRTITFVAVAVVLCLASYIAGIRPAPSNPAEVGTILFSDFKDPLDAKRMAVTRYDEKDGEYHKFEVKQVDGLWSLPSHGNYPADAQAQVADAANAMIGIKVLGVVSTDAGSHVDYGVVEPKPDKDDASTKGVGKLIEIDDANGKHLGQLIVGKEDKPRGDKGPQDLRFVRKPGSDAVLRVQMAVDKFSTKFDDWIERDLLKLKSWDVQEVNVRDYSIDKEVNANTGGLELSLDQRFDAVLAFNDKDSKWSLVELRDLKRPNSAEQDKKDEGKNSQAKKDDALPNGGTQAVDKNANEKNSGGNQAADPLADDKATAKQPAGEYKLPDDQELNVTKLNEMKTALSDLRIVDVQRKPAGLSGDLKANVDSLDQQARTSLARHGFYVVSRRGDIYSDQGEIHCLMKDGVRYVLRFGETAGAIANEESDKKDSGKKDGGKKDTDEKKPAGQNRYLFVKTEFDDSVIPAPKLLPLPEVKPAAKAEEKPTASKKADEAKKADPADNEKNYQAGAAEETVDKAKSADKKDDKKDASADDAKADAAAAEKKKEADPAEIEASRQFIEKENKRLQEEYDEKIKTGKKHVSELNARFADWYYVVSDDVYRKIHLGRDDIIKTKEKAADSPGPGPGPGGLTIPPNLQPGVDPTKAPAPRGK